MNWMVPRAGPFPAFVEKAGGAHFTCVDGKEYLDFYLGDTGAMTGHAPPLAVGAICDRIQNGTTLMLPTEDAIRVGEELKCISCTPAAQSSYIYPLTRKSQVLFYQTIQPGYDVLNKLTVA
jgi:glutamate-1-semialdehyde aminotransferase